jgi:NTE family protein
MSPSYSKADLVAEYYGKYIFDNAKFGDFSRAHAPLIIINATELASGSRFPFIQPMFDLICSDINEYPVSRAVAASSAVPVLFSPITLKNYAGECGYELPSWVEDAAKDEGSTSRKMDARHLKNYLDRKKVPWFHLVDGGISDNLGLREFYDIVSLTGDPKSALEFINYPKPSRVLIISVDARAKADTDWALQRYAPSISQVLGSVTAVSVSRYSNDTIDIVRYAYNNWAKELSTPERPVMLHFVEVSFDAVENEQEREYLHGIGTSFDLEDEEVDRLIGAGRDILRASPVFQGFLDSCDSDGRFPQ